MRRYGVSARQQIQLFERIWRFIELDSCVAPVWRASTRDDVPEALSKPVLFHNCALQFAPLL